MSDSVEAELKEDIKDLIGEVETPAKEVEKEPEPAPEAKEPEKKPEPAPPEKKDARDKQLEKTQQRLSALQESIEKREADREAKYAKNFEKVFEALGIPKEEPPAEPAAKPEPDPELRAEIDEVRRLKTEIAREREFMRIQRQHPESDPAKMEDDAWDEALAFYGIEKDAEELPDGITEKALIKARDNFFRSKVEALKKAPPVKEPTPKAPPNGSSRRIPPKTPGGAAAPQQPASHPSAPLSDRDEMLRDCRDLVGDE